MRQGKKYKEDVHCDRIEDVFTYILIRVHLEILRK